MRSHRHRRAVRRAQARAARTRAILENSIADPFESLSDAVARMRLLSKSLDSTTLAGIAQQLSILSKEQSDVSHKRSLLQLQSPEAATEQRIENFKSMSVAQQDGALQDQYAAAKQGLSTKFDEVITLLKRIIKGHYEKINALVSKEESCNEHTANSAAAVSQSEEITLNLVTALQKLRAGTGSSSEEATALTEVAEGTRADYAAGEKSVAFMVAVTLDRMQTLLAAVREMKTAAQILGGSALSAETIVILKQVVAAQVKQFASLNSKLKAAEKNFFSNVQLNAAATLSANRVTAEHLLKTVTTQVAEVQAMLSELQAQSLDLQARTKIQADWAEACGAASEIDSRDERVRKLKNEIKTLQQALVMLETEPDEADAAA